ncbi:recombinase [Pseudomonas sp. CFBP 13711]|uniref:site-specific integrase n=1 Tax=unclassified Pseudomonas TaxID=196821 RepID=UPI00177E0745|nr:MULTISPECIES: site-specific integrase [unclassified Pseudomonas]MBD8710105.1 recombinase [Pseudomonas sp. CFBP 13711]MBD8715393.1 recombinase [Pseudomonas sp. CFBP 13715]
MNKRLTEPQPGFSESFSSFDGYRCNFADDYWKLNRNTTISTGVVRGLLSPESEDGLLRTLKFFVINASAGHAQNIFMRYYALIKFGDGEPVSPKSIARYRQTLEADHEWYLGAIRVLVKQWHRLGYPGLHPVQLTNTRLVDLSEGSNEQGDRFFFIAVPRGKQPGQAFRLLFRKRAITEELFTILTAQAAHVRATVAAIWRFSLSENMARELPLFPNWKAIKAIGSEAEFVAIMTTDWLHLKSGRVSLILRRLSEQIGFRSERTGQPLNLSARRFRYTVGTRAAREGYGPLVIAELLDHADTQNVGGYTQNVPEHAAQIDRAVASQLAPFAQAFAGMIVSSKAAAVRGDDPQSDVRSTSGRGAGTCGSFGFCAASVPIPCYTCIHFQPWLNGPHQEVLSELLKERERVVSVTHDLTIASVLDRSILAVTQVVEACNARKTTATTTSDAVGT